MNLVNLVNLNQSNDDRVLPSRVPTNTPRPALTAVVRHVQPRDARAGRPVRPVARMLKSVAIGHPLLALEQRAEPANARPRRTRSPTAAPPAAAATASWRRSRPPARTNPRRRCRRRRSISSARCFAAAAAIAAAPRSPNGFRSRFRYRNRSPSRTILATEFAPTSHTALHRRFRHSRCDDAATPYAASVSIPWASTRHFPIFRWRSRSRQHLAAWKTCSDWCVNSRDRFSMPSS